MAIIDPSKRSHSILHHIVQWFQFSLIPLSWNHFPHFSHKKFPNVSNENQVHTALTFFLESAKQLILRCEFPGKPIRPLSRFVKTRYVNGNVRSPLTSVSTGSSRLTLLFGSRVTTRTSFECWRGSPLRPRIHDLWSDRLGANSNSVARLSWGFSRFLSSPSWNVP